MKNLRIKSVFIVIFLFYHAAVFSMGGRPGLVPMKAKQLLITDGEFLRYGQYDSGEKISDVFYVARVNNETGQVTIYLASTNKQSRLQLPKYYTNYNEILTVSLGDASLISSHIDATSNAILNHQTGTVSVSLDIDKKNSLAKALTKIWDGEILKTRQSRIAIKPQFSFWDIDSLGLIGMRFLDLESPGVVYVIIPSLADPIPVSFKYEGKEKVTTKAGNFETQKFNFSIADPFLAGLLGQYVKEYSVWKDTGSGGLIVKAIRAGREVVLEDISVWKDK